MKIKTKIINPLIPTMALQYAIEGDAGIDLVATSKSFDRDNNIVYGTNRAFEIPPGYVGLLFPRSSNAKKSLLLSNSVGVLDSNYRGEVIVKFKRTLSNRAIGFDNNYDVGDRVVQLIIMPYPKVRFEEASELSNTDRDGGFGSTGK